MTIGRIAEGRDLRTLFGVGAAGTLTDGQLLDRFARLGGEAGELAFAALVERHGPMVLRVGRSILRDEHGAHDAFQATFLILARKARTLWVRDSIGPWLHAVARRVAARSRVSEERRRRHERGAAGPETRRAGDPEADDLGRAIHEEIGRLPGPYRSAVVLCHLEGLTQHEAARRLDWPVGTLQSRLARGRAKLRERLGRRGLAPPMGTIPALPIPDALVAATARAASTLAGGAPIAGMIGPAVLALIHPTMKGMLMTKVKLGMMGLALLGGLAASTTGPAGRPSAKAMDEGPQAPGPGQVGEVQAPRAVPLLEPVPAVEGPRWKAAPPPANGPGIPVLLDFHAAWSGPCLQMRGEVQKLVDKGYPVRSMDIDSEPGEAARYRVTAIPTYIVIDGAGREVARASGAMPAARLAALYNGDETKPGKVAGELPREADRPGAEPGLTVSDLPKPWETVVRVKIHQSEGESSFGSGAIIRSTADESIILTCAHQFRFGGQGQPAPKDFPMPIRVDLFDGRMVGGHPAMVGCSERDIPGRVIDYDFTADLALIRIRPGRKLPASPVVPRDWKPAKGMKMYAVGCSHGQDATAWDTAILDSRVQMSQGSIMMKCAHEPKQGRAGGGLYTTDGRLAGVCLFSDPAEHVGLYAAPEAIHRLLDRNGFSSADAPDTVNRPAPSPADRDGPAKDPAQPEPTRLPAVSDPDRRLGEVERKLDRIIEALKDIRGDFPPPRPR